MIKEKEIVKLSTKITNDGTFRFSRTALEVLSFQENGIRIVLFGNRSNKARKSIKPGDSVTFYGFFKPFVWKDIDGNEQSRDDFHVKYWKKHNREE